MKDATSEAITDVVEKAQADALELLQSGRVFSYGLLVRLMADAKPIDRSVEEHFNLNKAYILTCLFAFICSKKYHFVYYYPQ